MDGAPDQRVGPPAEKFQQDDKERNPVAMVYPTFRRRSCYADLFFLSRVDTRYETQSHR